MKKYMSAILALVMIFSSLYARASFVDVNDGTLSWAGDAIYSLVEKGVINGYEDGTFRPDEGVTRAEFAKMITAAFGLDGSGVSYDDIALHWANEYITSLGGLMYCEDASFEPDKKATRADIAYCVAGVLNLESQDKEFIKKYSDYSYIPQAMQNKVSASAEKGIMIGYEDLTLRPLANVSRAEAAVIVHRALAFSADAPAIPSDPDVSEPSPAPSVPSVPAKPEDAKDHIYTLYPGKDILLLVSANKTVDAKTGEDAVKLTYRMANYDTEYTSVVPYDTEVTGIKTSIWALSQGDVFIMNTAFHGYIGNLHVFASFGDGGFNFDETVTGYGKGDYTLCGGKIKGISIAGKSTQLILEWNGTETTAFIPRILETNNFRPYIKNDKWDLGDINDVDPETEEEYVFIRSTNGIATDVMVSDYVR